MKRFLATLAFFSLITTLTIGQRFNGGLIIGGVASQLDGDLYGGYHKFGYLAGGLVSLRLTPHSSMQFEMEYIQKGSRVNADTLTNLGTTRLYRFHYLELPLLYQYTFAKRMSIEAGPAVDVLLGSREESDGIEVTDTRSLRPVTLAGIFGFSGFITPHLKANLRFNYSLISIRSTSSPYPVGYRHILFETGQYNNVLSFSLFWYFKPNEDL